MTTHPEQTHPVAVAIAGLGRSGWNIHAHHLAQLPDQFQIAAVTDADAERCTEAQTRFECEVYPDYASLLADQNVELVIVALPNHLHARAAIQALEAGKHVITEKPMATSLEDAQKMVDAAQRTRKMLTVFQQKRYNPDFVQVRKVIESGCLGRIVQIRMTENRFSRRWDWQTTQKFGGGTLNNTGPHLLDQALQLFGPAQPSVTCVLDRTLTLGDAEDFVRILLHAPDAPVIDIEISSCDAYPGDSWHISGTRGSLRGSGTHLEWRWVDPDTLPPRQLDLQPTPDRSYNKDNLSWLCEEWHAEEAQPAPHLDYYRALAHAIRTHTAPPVSPESVLRVIWLQEECHRLAPLNQTIF